MDGRTDGRTDLLVEMRSQSRWIWGANPLNSLIWKNALRTDGPTDWWTHGPMDPRTDERTNRPSYRDAWIQIKAHYIVDGGDTKITKKSDRRKWNRRKKGKNKKRKKEERIMKGKRGKENERKEAKRKAERRTAMRPWGFEKTSRDTQGLFRLYGLLALPPSWCERSLRLSREVTWRGPDGYFDLCWENLLNRERTLTISLFCWCCLSMYFFRWKITGSPIP